MMLPAEAGRQVEITIERVKDIARTTMETLQTEARRGSSDFRNTQLEQGAFGAVPKALDFAAQQSAAHSVFLETIEGVLTDLEQFQQNLLDCAEAHERNDDAVASTLSALASRYAGHQYASATRYDEARRDEALEVSSAAPPGSAEGGAPAQSGVPEAPEGPRSTE